MPLGSASRSFRAQSAAISTRCPFRTTRSLFAALDAGCTLTPWWRSGQLDRLLDEDHAALASRAVEFLERQGWSIGVEVTFAFYADRGSIDLLATRRADGAVLVVEIKTRLMSIEELLRTLDRKVRVVSRIVQEREGWRPKIVGRLVVFSDDSTNRRRVSRAMILDAALPLRGGTLHAWLRAPTAAGSGLVFLSISHAATGNRTTVARQRVRKLRSRSRLPARSAVTARTDG